MFWSFRRLVLNAAVQDIGKALEQTPLMNISFVARAKSFLRTLLAFPIFLIITLIPWLLAAHAFVLSRRFYEAGRDHLGVAFKIAAVVVAGFTAFSTLWCFVVWLVMLVRSVRGLETKPDD